MSEDTKKFTDQELREWITSTVEYLLFEEALARFDGMRYQQGLTAAQTRVLIATANLPQSLRSKLAGKYSEKYEKEE